MGELLLCEDDCDTREALSEALILAGYDVVAFRTGIQAIEWLAGNRPSIAVLDSALPWIEGDEVLRRMLASPRLKDVPAIIISADIKRIVRARTLTPHVLPKPFDPQALIEMVQQLVGRAEQAQAIAI